jgi:glycolate oxidase iron-sulfur subunit
VQTQLAAWIRDTATGHEADRILRACVHCGFCGATCPTYQLLGDELDSPRGRIYQIKEVLEGRAPTRTTQLHLDRCLTCRSCETTCPSGVEYGRLLEIGREVVDERVARPLMDRIKRLLVREVVSRRPWFALLAGIGRRLRPILPIALKRKLPYPRDVGGWPRATHPRHVLFLTTCAQDALLPTVDRAAARVLDRLGLSVIIEPSAGCCGALRAHLSDLEGARAAARRNIDAWWPHLERGIEAIVMTASGCGVQVKDYARLLAADGDYRARAARVSALTQDLGEWLARHEGWPSLRPQGLLPVRLAFQAPCTLQHGQKLRGVVEPLLESLGGVLVPVRDAHLCCGSAGSYSILQPVIAGQLRERKLAALLEGDPQLILSANVGCQSHLEAGAPVPVRHWIEWVDQRLAEGNAA